MLFREEDEDLEVLPFAHRAEGGVAFKEAVMKRHFSNRGEALAEVTAGRGLADRKTSLRTAFMTQAGRRTKSPQWFSPAAESQIPPQEGNEHKKRISGFLYEGVPKENRNAIQREKSFRNKKR